MIEIAISISPILFICYFVKEIYDTLKGLSVVVSMDSTCWVSWAEGIETYSTGSYWRPVSSAYFHLLLLLFWLIGLCLCLVFVSTDVDPILFVLDLHMKYTVEVIPLCTNIVWFVIMWYVRSVVVSLHTFTPLLVIRNAPTLWTALATKSCLHAGHTQPVTVFLLFEIYILCSSNNTQINRFMFTLCLHLKHILSCI